MNSLLFLCNLIWFTACLIVLFILRREDNNQMNTVVNQIKQMSSAQDNIRILFLDYAEPVFKQADDLLSADRPTPFIVVFHAPAWLVAAKTKKWKGHTIIHAQTLNFKSKSMVVIAHKKKYRIYGEVAAYLKFTS
ncbi:hypothetical protein [Paenibacillus lutrae]|uniref:Uncharacterized protein n=1 Tax=Paenibacillus lutrae TaxID=2078573 RepID=A0A7X3JY05_9BACL|nr:hypothetical protein [Paenibacillus lutrae]MVO98598.1 hypothetical protein [Paenibacillus lutrae]